MSVSKVQFTLGITHNRAEEMDHGVLSPALTWGSCRSFLRARGESASERALEKKREGSITVIWLH